jgi:hypothetical protein
VRIAITLTAIAAFALCVLSPLRALSGDTVPARIGGAVLRCAGDFDMARVDWVRAETDRDRVFYWLHRDVRREHTSVFGPVPAIVTALALLDFGDGDAIDDETLRSRERAAAAALLALAVALISIAAAANGDRRRAVLTGSLCALSFAGAASLGQAMWQATTALPALTGAIAALAWRGRYPRLAIATPALLLLAVMLRPTIAPLVLGIGFVWARDTKDRRTWIAATLAALVCVAPLVAWNSIHYFSPLPLGQWKANLRETHHVFTLGGVARGVAGLVASPSRGLSWFAPLAIAGIVVAVRSAPHRPIAIALLVQIVAMAAFFKWHGGQSFGPRLLAELTWVAIWLALAHPLRRRVLIPAAALTVVVGLIGSWLYAPAQWEQRRRPETFPAAFWDVTDSPIVAAFTHRDAPAAVDAPPVTLRCHHGTLSSVD